MYLYVIFVLFIIFVTGCSVTKQFESNKREMSLLFILSFFVFFTFAFRYNVGADYIIYNNIYDESDYNQIDNWEIGFKGIFTLFKLLGVDYYIFLMVLLFFNIVALLVMLCQNVRFIVLGAAIYFLSIDGFFFAISFYRQSISVSIFMISISFLLGLGWKRYFLLNGFGFLFHVSSLVTLPIFFIKFIRFHCGFLYVIAPVIIYFSGIFGWSQEFVIYILNCFNVYLEYVKTDAFSGESGMGFGYLLQLSLFIFLVLSANVENERERTTVFLYSLYLCLVGMSVNMLLFYRLSVFFSPVQAIAIPMLISKSRIKQKKILCLAVLALYVVLFLRNFTSPIFLRDFTPFRTVVLS